MSESCVFSLDPSHVGFANNLVPVWDVLGINLVAIGDVEEALPETHHDPQGLEGCCTTITESPRQNPRFKVVYRCPEPDFVFLSL